MSKAFSINIDTNGTIRDLESYIISIVSRTKELIKQVGATGEYEVHCKIYEYVAPFEYSGDLEASTGYSISPDGMGVVIYNDCDHAAFVEFGTGVNGKYSPYPFFSNLAEPVEWEYGQRFGDEGWWYPSSDEDPNPYKHYNNDGQIWAYTYGLPSRPFMWESAEELYDYIVPLAKVVFK